MGLAENVRAAREAAGLSQAALARQLNVSQATIAKIESGQTTHTRYLPQIAQALKVRMSDLDPSLAAGPPGGMDSFRPEITPAPELAGPKELPIYGSAMGGDGQIVIDTHPIEYVVMPSILAGVRGAYGVRIVGDSMEPAYFQGDLALVHPHLPPERETDVVIFDAPPDGRTEAVIKRLVGYSGQEWRLRQYNPPQEWTELRVDWPICHRVVGKYARR